MKMLFVIFLFLNLFFVSFSNENRPDSIQPENPILYEKVYLHVDRELYSPGDDIWFKSYLVSGINNQLIEGYKNIYVQLISDSGKVIMNKLLLSINGVANGDYAIPEDIAEGNYKLRAYTKYLENFGDESFFYKNIQIASAKNSIDLQNEKKEITEHKIELAFLPEGGSFVLNAINYVAFKAINEKGAGVSVSGKVIDELGNEVVPFQTTYKGMGKFILMPQEQKKYYAVLNEYLELKIDLPTATPEGIGLHVQPDGNYLQFTLTRNLKTQGTQNLLLLASHKGIELFNSQVSMSDFQHAQRLFKGLFPLGISKITILDANKNTLAERLIFVKSDEKPALLVNLPKQNFQQREKVEIDLTAFLPNEDTITSTLSVAVVHEDYFSALGNTQSIESFLLVDSELKGSLETPALLFSDDEQISSTEKLDLVMLINGWRNYYWDDLKTKTRQNLPGWADIGLTLKGNVKSLWGEKPVDGGKVLLGPFSRNFLFEETSTDYMGRFQFDRLYLKDSAKIMINSETRRGLRRTIPSLQAQNIFNSLVDVSNLSNICPPVEIPLKFYRDNYYRLLAQREFSLISGSILLKGVDISAPKLINGDGHYRLYGEPDVSLQLSGDDNNYSSVFDYLEGRVAGVIVMGEEIKIRNAQRQPLLVIDGLETEWDRLRDIPMGDIDKIEILKSGFSQAVYGSRGGDGVISILTRMGKGDWEYEFQRNVPGQITSRVRGFQQAREFYSPSYTLENKNNPKPDHRPTLYWNPALKTDAHQTHIEFFTGDNFARYNIIVEGISKKGKICVATGIFNVSL